MKGRGGYSSGKTMLNRNRQQIYKEEIKRKREEGKEREEGGGERKERRENGGMKKE
jgi:hypothetical protein